MNLKYKELRREAPTRHIMESKHTEAAPPEGRRGGTEFVDYVIYGRSLIKITIVHILIQDSQYYRKLREK